MMTTVLSGRPFSGGRAVSGHAPTNISDGIMTLYDATGFLASSLVAIAFCMKDIVALRFVALASNVAFLIYGIGLGLLPVWLLHATLLPINALRLCQVVRCDRPAQRPPSQSIVACINPAVHE
jgi:hypothetical protein